MGAKKGYFFIVVTIIMFTSYEVVLKFISGQLNSMQLTLCRFSVGFVILLPLALHTLKKRGERLDGKSVAYFALLGLLGIALSMPILHVSVNYAGSSVAAVLFSCNPVFVTFLAFFLLKEPILPRHIAALVLEVAGTIAIINPFQTSVNLLGTALTLLSTTLFSFYGVLGKRKCAQFGGAVVTCFSFFFGSLILLIIILLSHIPALAQMLTGAGLGEFANIPIFAGYTCRICPTCSLSRWAWRASAFAAISWPWSTSPPAWSPWSTSSSPPWPRCWPGWSTGRSSPPTCCWASCSSWPVPCAPLSRAFWKQNGSLCPNKFCFTCE